MGQACQRRAAPQEVKAAGAPEKKTAASEPKPAPKPHDPKRYTTDYSRFANIEDSDEEEEKKKEKERVEAMAELEEDRKAAAGWSGNNPSEAQRCEVVDQMMELCRKTFKEHRAQLGVDDKEEPKAGKLPKDYKKPVGIINVKELAKYSCSNDRILLSCYGDIYDVSSRPDQYGYGPKSWMAGKDITWTVITGKETAENCNRFYDLFKLDQDHLARYMQILCGRLVTLQEEFGEPVGRLDRFHNERDLPPAPTDEVEECKQQ
eukprot:TRINITY_DN105648_c0_g1_i1.p1 TRINITY_DN105648_c0_g1~~TRINITY_DN105648_c0_g1_i1.p1  ORF type:complete len:285 (+),score=71.11 TRINITY_DN105648_c0_g1_i1:71-856(+)